jgi:hypothetical protein
MAIDTHPKRRPPTPEQIIAEQKRQANASRQQQAGRPSRQANVPPATASAAPPASVPAKTAASVPATMAADNRTPEQRYVDDIAPSSIAGQLVKFSKEGKFTITETEEELSPDEDFVALCDETLIGWIRFRDDGEPPDRHQGLLYNGFVMPPRASLGDLDERNWPEGLSGAPADPWQHQICLVLQEPKTQALYTFVTSSQTGRRAVGNLLRHYDRMQRTDKDSYPVVRLKPSGFNHKDERVGWVHTPSFAVVGRTPKNSAAVPDTSVAADLNDEIPCL